MKLTEVDSAWFLLYAGGAHTREETLALAQDPDALGRHIDEWEASKRGGRNDGGEEVTVSPTGPTPMLSGGAAIPRE